MQVVARGSCSVHGGLSAEGDPAQVRLRLSRGCAAMAGLAAPIRLRLSRGFVAMACLAVFFQLICLHEQQIKLLLFGAGAWGIFAATGLAHIINVRCGQKRKSYIASELFMHGTSSSSSPSSSSSSPSSS